VRAIRPDQPRARKVVAGGRSDEARADSGRLGGGEGDLRGGGSNQVLGKAGAVRRSRAAQKRTKRAWRRRLLPDRQPLRTSYRPASTVRLERRGAANAVHSEYGICVDHRPRTLATEPEPACAIEHGDLRAPGVRFPNYPLILPWNSYCALRVCQGWDKPPAVSKAARVSCLPSHCLRGVMGRAPGCNSRQSTNKRQRGLMPCSTH